MRPRLAVAGHSGTCAGVRPLAGRPRRGARRPGGRAAPSRSAPIDVDRAAKDPAELGRALARPYRDVRRGARPAHGRDRRRNDRRRGGRQAGQRRCPITTTIELGDARRVPRASTRTPPTTAARRSFVGGKLYLRPRYQRWHGRAPETPDEPAALRDRYFEAIARDLGPARARRRADRSRRRRRSPGRAGRKIAVKLAPSPRAAAARAARRSASGARQRTIDGARRRGRARRRQGRAARGEARRHRRRSRATAAGSR